MAKKTDKRGLGRGLSALLAETEGGAASATGVPQGSVLSIPIEKILPNPDQPRRTFKEDELKDLSASIKEKGVLQPLIVREDPDDSSRFQIVAGERRWRASQIAQLHELPVLVRNLDDTEMLEIAIIENIQREDLNPVEEAMGYRQLMDNFGHTQEVMAKVLGKSRSHIANLLRLLSLPDEVLEMLQAGDLSAGHARALVTAENAAELAKIVVASGLSVRETEALAKSGQKAKPAKQKLKPEKDADTRALEADLTAQLRLKVAIEHGKAGEGGEIRVRYNSLEDLDRVCQLLAR